MALSIIAELEQYHSFSKHHHPPRPLSSSTASVVETDDDDDDGQNVSCCRGCGKVVNREWLQRRRADSRRHCYCPWLRLVAH
uniref:Uncharacterized protein n=1 Tax=Brassica campestris TaxID=3711 RepID=A0A3P6CQY7_BRACM|nr:unnamed protein product [Brassica rapa]